jgi:hypothetical protein
LHISNNKNKQVYQCLSCNYKFTFKDYSWIVSAYSDYTLHKQTYKELEVKYNYSSRTIRKYFDRLNLDLKLKSTIQDNNIRSSNHNQPSSTKTTRVTTIPINLIMDTTYFGRNFGVVLFRGKEISNGTKGVIRNLYWHYITKSETVADYIIGIQVIRLTNLYSIKSFTVDNKSGLINKLQRLYPTIPIQLCQFHSILAVTKYITRNPKNKCDKELRELVRLVTTQPKQEFITKLTDWISNSNNINYLQERNHKDEYIHQNTRSALKSIITNLEYIFTKEKYPYLSIPNTTNSMEGGFGNWKYKIRLHKGLSINRKKQMIDMILRNQNEITRMK